MKKLLILALLALPSFAATLPRPATEVAIQVANGQQLLSAYRGKVVVLGFILTS